MPEQPLDRDQPEYRYDETVAPSNPPNSVLRPAVRRMALWTYLGIIVVFFLVVGAAFVFWSGTGRGLAPDGDDRTDPSAVGTSGDRTPAIAGKRIDLENVVVEQASGDTFQIRNGNERATVVTAGGMPTVRAGQRIDVSGTIEQNGNEIRIHATRIDVR